MERVSARARVCEPVIIWPRACECECARVSERVSASKRVSGRTCE